MRLKFILIFLLLASLSQAQNLTGVWRGHFVSRQYSILGTMLEENYKYEIQLNHLFNNALQGVTYSYKTTVFYGKTSLQGIFTKGTKNVLIKELKMLELKIEDMSDPCMMTCNLEYSKTGNKETLVGTFTSLNIKKMEDCGGGMVYLEKVPESDFEKEDFLLKKKPTENSKITPLPYNHPSTKKIYPVPNRPQPPFVGTAKPKYKPGAEDALANNKVIPKPKTNIENIAPVEDHQKNNNKPEAKPLAKELSDRTNNLVKTLYVDEGEIEISLYDNGEIDNDTVSVYHNNELVINHGRLSTTPLTIRIKVDALHPTHEFIMVADNLGEIPPNTSLMTISAGKKQYSVFLTSDTQKNAKVILQYKPQQEQSRFK